MKKTFLIPLLSISLWMASTNIYSQTMIKGCVADKKSGAAMPGVNIYVKDSYDGTITGPDGCYSLEVSSDKTFILVFSFIGYQKETFEIVPETSHELNVVLRESSTPLNAVTITAGSFEASDKNRAAVMTPMDIYTTAGSLGDIGTALKTLPGTQVAPDDGRLFVRGGDASETRVLMDGILAARPYYSKVPDLPTRGRFAPSMFEGTFFSTGGYSAQFGQALSSVLVLETEGVATEELTSLSLMSIGGEVAQTWAGKNHSFSAGAGYYNFGPYHRLAQNRIDWEDDVESGSVNVNFRRNGKNGKRFKFFAAGDYGGQSLFIPDGYGNQMKIVDQGGNLYVNTTFHAPLTEKTVMKTGASLSYDDQELRAGIHNKATNEWISEGKIKLITQPGNTLKLTWGGAWQMNTFNATYGQGETGFSWRPNFTDHNLSGFAEAEWRLLPRMAFRPGVRFEHATISDEYKWSPRVALAMKTSENTTFSLAWGHFYQTVQNDFLKYKRDLKMQKAEHYIFGFQTGELSNRIFRAEGYHKKYNNLPSGNYNAYGEFVPEGNRGEGFASGFDLFFRDKTLFKNTDYWISYSYIHSKRKFLDYPKKVVPEYIAPHTINVVAKHFVVPLRTQIASTWTWNSGRPYHIPGSESFMAHTSPNYSNVELSFSYLTSIMGHFTIAYFSFSNVLGRDNVLGYRRIPASTGGEPALITIRPDVKQFMFLGVFVSIN